jgi:pyroglutamyl-peptidase
MKFIRSIIIIGIILILPVSSIGINIITTHSTEQTIEIYSNNPVVLITGFGPFSKFDVNPSQLIAETLNGQTIDTATVIGIIVKPNLSDFTEPLEFVYQAIDDYEPDLVICLGLAAPYPWIRLEILGINLGKSNESDNQKLFKLDPEGPLFRFSNLPTFKIAREIRKNGIPARTTFHAGLSLCNGMLYSVAGYIEENDLPIKSGFIHVPLMKSQDPEKGMELEKMVEATKISIELSLI